MVAPSPLAAAKRRVSSARQPEPASVNEDDGPFPDEQGGAPVVTDDIVGAAGWIDDQTPRPMDAACVALRAGQDENVLVAVVAMGGHPSARGIAKNGRCRSAAVVGSIEPVLVNPGPKLRP